MGYEPTLSEKGRIAYDPDIALDESCYREASSSDVFVLIIGGRYGSAASEEDVSPDAEFYERYESVTRKEYESASKREIPTYILVEKKVMSEFETYKKNRDNETIEYAHVDSINIFKFIDSIFKKSKNNPVYQFDHYAEIEAWLKEQWSGYFKELINRKSENKQLHSLNDKVEELSSINASLQRYLEEVVSSVSTPEKAEEIISLEKSKISESKKLREFMNNSIVEELLEDELSQDNIIEIFTASTTLEEMLSAICEKTEDWNFDKALDHWKKSPEVVDEINELRALLGQKPVSFEK
jgi:hypothetical protein